MQACGGIRDMVSMVRDLIKCCEECQSPLLPTERLVGGKDHSWRTSTSTGSLTDKHHSDSRTHETTFSGIDLSMLIIEDL